MFSYDVLSTYFGLIISTLASITIGAVVYGIAIMITGAMEESDMDFIPEEEK